MIEIVSGLWGKFAGIIVAIIAAIGALFGYRYKVRAGMREQISNEQQARTLERIRDVKRSDANVDGLSIDDVKQRVREHGWSRD